MSQIIGFEISPPFFCGRGFFFLMRRLHHCFRSQLPLVFPCVVSVIRSTVDTTKSSGAGERSNQQCTSNEHQNKTKRFISLIASTRDTTDQNARDMICVAIKLDTLKTTHLTQVVTAARTADRALLCLDAALQSFVELHDVASFRHVYCDKIDFCALYNSLLRKILFQSASFPQDDEILRKVCVRIEQLGAEPDKDLSMLLRKRMLSKNSSRAIADYLTGLKT